MTELGELLWTPSPGRVAATRMARFADRLGLGGYEDLHRMSISEPDVFWPAVWDECGLVGEQGSTVLDGGPSMAEARFFPTARVSVVEHVLRHTGTAPAVIATDESGETRTISWEGLAVEVGAMAAALRESGVWEGDRVAAWLPNGIEVVVAMLGAAALGAVFSSTSPDFGASGVLDRFGQIEPKVLFGVDGYRYGGRHFDRREVRDEIVAGLPTLRRTVVLGDDWEAFLAPHRGTPAPLTRRSFDHPWYVLYSSGTTGTPKCIVHATGRVLLQHAKEHQLHTDLSAGDRLLYVTTCGWMMWNWLVSALASGVTIVAVDGNVGHPSTDRLWELVDDHRVDVLGVGAKYLDAVANEGYSPARRHQLGSLRTLASTGSPLSPERFAWVYEHVKDDLHLASISGGTDLVLDGGVALDDQLRARIADTVRTSCSPRHVPRRIVAVEHLPRTRSGKLVELAVADAVNGREVRNTEALADPAVLWAVRDAVART